MSWDALAGSGTCLSTKGCQGFEANERSFQGNGAQGHILQVVQSLGVRGGVQIVQQGHRQKSS